MGQEKKVGKIDDGIDDGLKMEIEMVNAMARELRELLYIDVKKPFTIDEMMELEIEFNTPYKLNEFFAKEIFNSKDVYITGIRIIDSVIEFTLQDKSGNIGKERVFVGEKVDFVKLWEHYLISMISTVLLDHIVEKHEKLNGFINDLKAMLSSIGN